MAIAVVQVSAKVDSSSNTVSPVLSNPVVGNNIVVVEHAYNGGAFSANPTCADDATGGSNSYGRRVTQRATDHNTDQASIFRAPIVNTKATLTVTVTEQSGAVCCAAAVEVSGLDAAPDDIATGATDTDVTSPFNCASGSPAQNDEILFGVFSFAAPSLGSFGLAPAAWGGDTPTQIYVNDGPSINSEYGCAAYLIIADGAARTVSFASTTAPGAWCPVAVASFKAGAAAGTADQEGARFGNDDGNEAAHTFAAAQDANITAPLGQNLLIRMLIDGTGDLASAAYTLRYQKNGAGGFLPVPVGASVAEVYGTVTFGAIGTGASGSTNVTPSFPAGITAGQYLVAVVTSGGSGNPTPSTPSGWTPLGSVASTDGTYGVDTGPRRCTAFGKIADGTESGTLSITITGGNTARATISRFTKAGSGSWVVDVSKGHDSDGGTGVSVVGDAAIDWHTGDAVLVGNAQRVDTVTQSSQALTASGITFGTRTNQASTAVTNGNDHRHVVDTYAAVTAGSGSQTPTWAYTGSAGCSAAVVIIRLREYTAPVTNEIYVATSANIAAGGEATTARLTAPATKSTSDFVTGRRWDDENGADATDITNDDYAEFEWCLQAQAPAANGDYFDLRVYAGAAALAGYGVTPRWTIGTPAVAGVGPTQRAQRVATQRMFF